MKKAFLFFSAFVFTLSLFAQQTPAAPVKKSEDMAKFKELTYDFGKIKQGAPVTHDFAFVNVSDAPIVIESAIASCGCTTPVKPEAPISKGQNSVIKAGFNAASAGPFNKTITVKVVGSGLPVLLRITGEVLSPEAYAKYESEKTNKQGL